MNVVYKITNLLNHKCYIGKTSKPADRLRRHFSFYKSDRTRHPKLHAAFSKYGIEKFDFEIIEHSIDDLFINTREKFWVSHYDSFNHGYNSTIGGEYTWNHGKTGWFSENHRKKNSDKWKGSKNPNFNAVSGSKSHRANFIYQILTPTGQIVSTDCLKVFCDAHKLQPSHMCSTLKGERSQHHGFRIVSKTRKNNPL